MTNGTNSNKKEKWQVWYDPFVEDTYIILHVDEERQLLNISWQNYGMVLDVPKTQCEEDVYLKTLSRLERELF